MPGSTAPLSPREESALRRIGIGINLTKFLPEREVERLVQLGLVEQHDSKVVLTAAGAQRIAILPHEIGIAV